MYSIYRVMEEIEEVVGDKPDVEADDLEKLTYMTQVLCNSLCMVPSVLSNLIMYSAQISHSTSMGRCSVLMHCLWLCQCFS